MAPRKAATETTAPQTQPTPTAVANTAMKTVQGYTVQLIAFIPVDPKDLRTQAAIPTILLGIEEGEATLNDLMPYLKQVEFRSQNTRKRVTEDEYAALFAKEEPTVSEHGEEFVEQGDGGGDAGEGTDGGEEEEPSIPGFLRGNEADAGDGDDE